MYTVSCKPVSCDCLLLKQFAVIVFCVVFKLQGLQKIMKDFQIFPFKDPWGEGISGKLNRIPYTSFKL